MLTLFILTLLLLTQFQGIVANPFTTRLTTASTSIEAGQSFTVTFEVRGSAGIFGLTSNLNYDSTKLEITGSSEQSGFALTLGSNIVVDNTAMQSGNFNFARITFKAKAGFVVGESTQISVSNVVGFDGTNEVNGSNSSITINVVPPKSTNNFLSNLETNAGLINFNKNTLSYTLIVDNSVTTANITGTTEDSKATVSGLGSKTLRVYSNPFNITVSAENGATRRYTINIIRRDESGNAGALSTNNTLRKLDLDVCDLEFKSEVLEYRCEVDNLIEDYILNVEVSDDKAVVQRDAPNKLSLGENVISLKVTSESGDVRIYTISITRSSSAPTVRIEDLEEALKTLTSNEIGIEMPEDGIIPTTVLSLIKSAKKTLVIIHKNENGKTLYEWHIDGSRVNPGQPIKTLIILNSKHDMIQAQTNFAQGLVMTFGHNPNLPLGTRVKYYLDDSLSEFTSLNLYYYNPNTQTLELKRNVLVVEENHVWLPLEHTSDYFLTPATFKQQNQPSLRLGDSMFWVVLALIQLLIIIGLIIIHIKHRKKYFRLLDEFK